MKTFKEFMQESSLSRIQSKAKKGIAVMSASRGDKSAKENRARGKQLDKDIRGRFGRGATKVTGSYLEKGDDGKERRVKEKSHVIDRGKMGKRKFKKAVKKLAQSTRTLRETSGRGFLFISSRRYDLTFMEVRGRVANDYYGYHVHKFGIFLEII